MNSKQAQHLLKLRGIEVSEDDSLLTMVALQDVVFANMQEGYTSIGAMQSILRSKGIRVKDDDPIFNILTLNSILLEESKSKLRLDSSRQKIKLVLAPTVAVATTAFVFGMFFGTPNTSVSPIFIAAIAVILGAVLGVTGLLIYRREDENKTVNYPVGATTFQPSEWTEFEVNLVSKRAHMSDRNAKACWDVLSGNSTIDDAASTHNMFKNDIEKKLKILVENR